jgi:type VI secretion system protein VasD
MMDRRTFLFGGAGLGLLVACVPAAGAATVTATGTAGMNPGPDGSDRPLTLQVIQMRGTGAFDGADFFALQNPAGALGGDFIRADQIVLSPGGSATKAIALDPGVAALGFVAGFRDPGGKAFRAKSAVSPTAKVGFIVEIGAAGLVLKPA